MNPAERTCDLIDVILCGYPSHIREARLILSLGSAPSAAFADDSGNDEKSQHLVLNALVAPPDQWKEFSHKWYASLISENPKPLRKDSRGKIRYKANYADNRNECFAGFSSQEVDEKTDHLTEILTEYLSPGYGLCCSMSHEVFHGTVKERALRTKKGKLHPIFKDPYYPCFDFIILAIINIHVEMPIPHQKIDFFFDQHGKTGDRCLRMYRNIKERLGTLADNVMGQAFPVDDAEVMPIQAADMMASRFKKALANPRIKSSEKFRT